MHRFMKNLCVECICIQKICDNSAIYILAPNGTPIGGKRTYDC